MGKQPLMMLRENKGKKKDQEREMTVDSMADVKEISMYVAVGQF